MTKEKLAAQLNGVEYGWNAPELFRLAKDAGLAIIYGDSDDLLEFRGAIDDEVGAWEGATVRIDAEGVLPNWDVFCYTEEEEAEFEKYFARKPYAKEVEAVWNDSPTDSYAWTVNTEIPHATFDIVEDGQLFSRGIVISMTDLK